MVYLTGAGHFGFGFLCGALIASVLMMLCRKRLFVQLYAPFFPFLIGILAVSPYLFYPLELCDFSMVVQLFVLYPLVHCSAFLAGLLSNLHLVAVVCGGIYALFIWHYISLVKKVRRYGWQ